MSTTTASRLGPGFLSFNTQEYRIVITGSALHPPEKHLLTWQEEGFETKYIRFNAAEQADYIRTIKSLHKDLQLGGKYAIICYGNRRHLHPLCGWILTCQVTLLPSC